MSHTKRALRPLKKQKIDNRDKWPINGHISPHGCRCRLMIGDAGNCHAKLDDDGYQI